MSESSTRRRRLGTVVAIALSLAALVVSMSGIAGAKAPDTKDQIRLLTTATGSLEVTANGEQTAVPMQHQAFTQDAGSAIMFITTVGADYPATEGRDCDAYVAWNALGDTLFLPDTHISNMGIWSKHQTFFLPSTATNTSFTVMNVGASSNPACPYGEGGSNITFLVQVQVQVWALQ